jgi:hypothetical protein
MLIKRLAFDDQLVSLFAADDQNDDFAAFDIIESSQLARAQFEFSQRIRSQLFDGLGFGRRLLFEPCNDRRLKDSPLARGQRTELALRVAGNRNPECHALVRL